MSGDVKAEANELKLEAILLNEPPGTDDIKEIEQRFFVPPLYDDLEKVVPMVPLLVVGEGGTKDAPCYDCCLSCNKCSYMFWNMLSLIFCYPCAACCNECMRAVGYMIYYFCLVPIRECVSVICHPCIEACWRCIQPCIVCNVALGKATLRPCVEVCGGFVGDLYRFCLWPCGRVCYKCRTGKSTTDI